MTLHPPTPAQPSDDGSRSPVRTQALRQLLAEHRRLLLDPDRHRDEIAQAIAEVTAGAGNGLAGELKDFILGAGWLQRYLDDDTVTEIMAIGATVHIERNGKIEQAEGFASADEAMILAERMALRQGERFQIANPIVDFAWIDGSRVNLVHPVVAGGQVAITVRKPNRSRPLDLESLVLDGTIPLGAADLLTRAVGQERRNLLFTGGQGAGKTTLLTAAAAAGLRTTPQRRVVLIQDTPEIALSHPHLLAMQAFAPAPGQQGARAVTLAELTRACKRQRPDLVIVGEVRGAEGVDLLALAQSEATGVVATLHIAAPEDLCGRFYYFSTLAGLSISQHDLETWVYDTWHLVCHVEKGTDGRRRVQRIVRLDPASRSMTDLWRINPDTDQLEEVVSP